MSARGLFPSGYWIDEVHILDAADLENLRRKRNALKALAFPYVYSTNDETAARASTALSAALESALNRAVAESVAKREAELVEHFARRFGVAVDPDVVRRIVEVPYRLDRLRKEAATRGTALHALIERQTAELREAPFRILIDDTSAVNIPGLRYAGVDDGLRA